MTVLNSDIRHVKKTEQLLPSRTEMGTITKRQSTNHHPVGRTRNIVINFDFASILKQFQIDNSDSFKHRHTPCQENEQRSLFHQGYK